MIYQETVKRWDLFEIELSLGEPETGNPFTDIWITGEFTAPGGQITRLRGFFSGQGVWKIRYMPCQIGTYFFRVQTNHPALMSNEGCFTCTMNEPCVHGSVSALNGHFHYSDGTAAFICGTTLYAWWYRPEEVCAATLGELKKYGFNKVRMLVFPKYLAGFTDFELTHQPPCLPFERDDDGKFDFSRPVPAYFDLLEYRLHQLMDLGVEADVILFHNYDFGMWGIDDQLTDSDAEKYLDYLMARIGSFRNIWWSLANEYDIWKKPDGSGCISKTDRRDWNRLGEYVHHNDPYLRPISIHNIGPIYPNRPWLSHVSVQFPNTYSLLMQLRGEYPGKPVINDEYQYEGNLIDNWGNLSGEAETFRHWLSVMAGCYATHGECFVVNGNRRDIFWTYGGTIRGTSAPRISYLKRLVSDMPFERMSPDLTLGNGIDKFCLREGRREFFFLYAPGSDTRDRTMSLGVQDGVTRKYCVRVYDLWNMKETRSFTYAQGEISNPKRDADGKPIADPMRIYEEGLVGVRFSIL